MFLKWLVLTAMSSALCSTYRLTAGTNTVRWSHRGHWETWRARCSRAQRGCANTPQVRAKLVDLVVVSVCVLLFRSDLKVACHCQFMKRSRQCRSSVNGRMRNMLCQKKENAENLFGESDVSNRKLSGQCKGKRHVSYSLVRVFVCRRFVRTFYFLLSLKSVSLDFYVCLQMSSVSELVMITMVAPSVMTNNNYCVFRIWLIRKTLNKSPPKQPFFFF